MFYEVGSEGSWVTPGMESQVTVLSCTGIDADSKDEEASDGEDLDTREPEFKLPVKADG